MLVAASGRYRLATAVRQPSTLTSRMQSDIEFFVDCVGALAVGEAVVSPPAAARSKPHHTPRVRERGELQSEQGSLVGSLQMPSQFLR
jgi:hypothetical protein